MALVNKKISHKDMREDYLVTQYFHIVKFYEENKKLVQRIGVGILAIIVIVLLYLNNVKTNNENATTELGKVLPYYDRGQYELAINGVPQENIRGLKTIVDDYGTTDAGEMATFFLANAYYAIGQYDEALKNFEDVDFDENDFSASAIAGEAACYEVKGEHHKAAEKYEKAAIKAENKSLAAEYFHNAAVNYYEAQDNEKAISIYKRIKKDYPTSQFARESDKYLAQFGAI